MHNQAQHYTAVGRSQARAGARAVSRQNTPLSSDQKNMGSKKKEKT